MEEGYVLCWFLLLCLFCHFGQVCGLLITRLQVPRTVQANSSSVVLDCDYWMDDWERSNGFVLKWYIDHIHLVYQWIPPRPPQVLGKLKGRLDPYYRASSDPLKQHRALKIYRPDPALSGTYTCTIATFDEEDTDTAMLLVWAPTSRMDLHYWRPTEFLVNITCRAHDVAPNPEFRLYIIDPSGNRKTIINRERTDIEGSYDGVFQSQAWGLLIYSETKSDSTIGCTIFIPGTQYRETRDKVYHKNIPVITTTTTSTTTTEAALPDEEAIRSATIANSGVSLMICFSHYNRAVVFFSSVYFIVPFLLTRLLQSNGRRKIPN